MKLVLHQRSCTVTFFITSRVMRKQRQHKFIYFMLMLVGIELMFSSPLLTSLFGLNLLGSFSGFGQFFGAIWILFCINAIQHNFLHLVLTRFEKPDCFWIRGFKETHLRHFLDCREGMMRSAHQRKTQSS
jgi:fatty-acid desaturase